MEQRLEAIDKRFEAISKQVANSFGWTIATILPVAVRHAVVDERPEVQWENADVMPTL